MRRIFNVYLTSVLVLVGLVLLSSCEADLKVKTNAADLDCAVLTEDTYCIKVRNGQINSVKDLALVQDQVLTSASGFSLSWKMPETAKGIVATKVMLASDAACTQEVKSAEIEIQDQVYTFTNIKDGIYYGCVFAKARAAGLLAAKNNGIRILVETAQPTIESESEVLYSNGRAMDKNPNIKSIGAVSALWIKTAGPGELTFTDTGAAVPTITASVDGSYTINITATNEVGGTSTKTFILIYDSTPPVLKDIAPILTSAPSVAIKSESDEKDLQLYRWEIIRAPGGVSPELQDADSATVELSLPSPGVYELKVSVSDQAGNIASTRVLVTKQTPAAPPTDTTNPSAPAAITVAAYSNTTSVSASYTAGSDANFSTHNVKACAASDCSTACLSVSQDIASPVTVSSLVNGSAYYICLQAVDLSGNVSAYVASSNSVTVDTAAPTAPSSLGFGSSFSSSTTLSLGFAVGTDPNFGTHDTRLCTASDCTTGCGSIIEAVSSPVSLTGAAGSTYYGCARSRDLAGNTSSWIASIGTMTIDNSNPTAPSAITVPLYGNTSVEVTYTAGTDLNFVTHNVKACTASNCSTGCQGVIQDSASPVTVSSLVHGSSYWICLQSVDQTNNVSAYVASGNSVTIDTTNPTAPASPAFSSAFNNTTTATLSWIDGTDTNFSTHKLKACTDSGCSVSCTSTTEDAASPGSISGLSPGTAYYACVQSVDLNANTSAFIASGTTVLIDTDTPTEPAAIAWSGAYSSSTTASLSWTNGSDSNFSTHNLKACTDSGCSASCTSVTQDAATPGSISGMTAGSSYYACLQTVDLTGNTSAYVASASPSLIDTTNPIAPSAVTVPAYSNASSVNVTYTAGTDTNFSTHNVKACTNTDCSTGCLSVTQDLASPGTVGSLVNGTAYYICLQAVDLATNSSAYVASGNSVTIDTTNPAAPSNPAWAASSSTDSSVALTWTNGTDTNFSTHNLKACTSSDCVTGCVASTQDAATPGVIAGLMNGTSYYACVQSQDLAGNVSAWLASATTTTIDSHPTAVVWDASPTISTSANLSWVKAAYADFSTHNVKACTDSGCSTACTTPIQTASASAMINGLTYGSSYYGCVQSVFVGGSTSAWISSASAAVVEKQALDLVNGLVGYYPFDGSAQDFSGQGLDLTTSGSFTNGMLGQGHRLTAGQTATISTPAQFTSTQFSVSAWIKVNSAGELVYGDNQFVFYVAGDSRLRLYYNQCLYGCGHDDGNSSTVLAANTWYHVAVVFGSSIVIYVNGVADSTWGVILYTPPPIGGSFAIGRNGFDGTIDELRLYNRALSSPEIANLYAQSAFTPFNITGLRAWYDALDTATIAKNGSDFVSTWQDKSGFNNHLTTASPSSDNGIYSAFGLNNKPTITQNNYNAPNPLAGVLSGVAGGDQAHTVFLVSNMSAQSTPFQIGNASASEIIELWCSDANECKTSYNSSYVGFRRPSLGSPHILSMDYSGSDSTINGRHFWINSQSQPVISSTALGALNLPASPNINLGKFMNGSVSEFLFYNRRLSDNERLDVEAYLRSKWGLGAGLTTKVATEAEKQTVVGTSTATFSASDFTRRFSHPENRALSSITVTKLPTAGTLKLSGSAVTVGQSISTANLANVTMDFAAPSWWGKTEFQWTGNDGMSSTPWAGNFKLNQVLYGSDGYGFSKQMPANPLAGSITMTGCNSWPVGFTKGNAAFVGAVSDGANLWLVPRDADRLIKVNLATCAMTGYSSWPAGFTKGANAFAGGVFDGHFIWLIPQNASHVVRVNSVNGAMTGYNAWPAGLTNVGNELFEGGTFDGQNIWMVPRLGDRVVALNTATGVMTGYNSWPAGTTFTGNRFSGAVDDGQSIWLVPHYVDRVIKINKSDGTMTGYNGWPAGISIGNEGFNGAVFDGQNIWLIPFDSNMLVKINKDSGAMSGYDSWPVGFSKPTAAFVGGAFDGENIWLIPHEADRLISMNKDTGVMTDYSNWPAGFTKDVGAFTGGTFDGQNIWAIPYNADRIIKISSSRPSVVDSEIATRVNTSLAFIATNFSGNYSDPNATALTAITIIELPASEAGILKLSGNAINVNDTLGSADFVNITFVPTQGWVGTATFKWKATNGTNYSTNSARVTIKVGLSGKGDGSGSQLTSIGNPLEANAVMMTGYSTWPVGFTKGDNAFSGGVFDGKSIWMIPQTASAVVKIDKDTGTMIKYDKWPAGFALGSSGFSQGVFDGTSIWLIPNKANQIVKINRATGVMTGYSVNCFTNGCFAGAAFDGQSIRMSPTTCSSLGISKIDKDTGILREWYGNYPAGYSIGACGPSSGAIYDGLNFWILPNLSNQFLKINSFTEVATGYAKPGGAYGGAVFDGKSIWAVPSNGWPVLKIDKDTGAMTSYSSFPASSGSGFRGGVYDGKYVWLVPHSASKLVRVDSSGTMTGFNNWPSGFASSGTTLFSGGVFDGNNIWLIPAGGNQVVKVSTR